MEITLFSILRLVLAFAGGAAIGLGFGLIQAAARRRYDSRQEAGKLRSGWAVMPGSAMRIACLLLVLAAIQGLFPAMFADGARWWLSAGVAAGYGGSLLSQLLRRRAAARGNG